MKKRSKWQFILILSVSLLTVYNILPTVFFYSKPLKKSLSVEQAQKVVEDISLRVDQLEKESVDFVHSFCSLLGISPKKVTLDEQSPSSISIEFSKDSDNKLFCSKFPRAGSSISFGPARLMLVHSQDDTKKAILQRQVPLHLSKNKDLFSIVQSGSVEQKKLMLSRASEIAASLSAGKDVSKEIIEAKLNQDGKYIFDGNTSVFKELSIDFSDEKITLIPRKNKEKRSDELVFEIAKIKRELGEKIIETSTAFEIPFHKSLNTSSAVVFHLDRLAAFEIQDAITLLKKRWSPSHPDLKDLTIVDEGAFEALPLEQKSLCLVFSSPFALSGKEISKDSLYIFAKGFERLQKTYEGFENSPLAITLQKDLESLQIALYELGFFVAPKLNNTAFGEDFHFEKPDFAGPVLAATREEFYTPSNKKVSLLELTNLEERILCENKMDSKIHQELLEWKDNYKSAQVSLDSNSRYCFPKPTKNAFLNNLALTLKKIVRGDENRIIRWGLDLSGGKSVEIELLDSSGSVVTDDEQIKQGMGELYSRVNKMGLSEVSIRQVGQHVVLDFPGSQALSASDLIQASKMYFHVVNEKFSPQNSSLGSATNQFLQSVWDEAQFVGKTDSETINEIAIKRLQSNASDAKTLRENGLTLFQKGKELTKETSKVTLQRGSGPRDWSGLSHPLMIVFCDPALEGSHLENIYSSYDPQKGNFLSFGVLSSSFDPKGNEVQPQKSLHEWTSKYSKDGVQGTENEAFSPGRGWRMAVVLNDSVISSPTLNEAISHSGSISGSFSQNEVQRLCQDLKAGSLSYSPRILSEKNVSPELGKADREKGILATAMALALVIGAMITYYRFSGLVASIAVVFNLLIMWATLQNLGATLTLAGLAGIILTVGMAVDANVLVFERIKEEQAQGKEAKEAIAAGYKRAFSAIVDSNITTIIAALILLNFDAGPIKSFAMNLIIGIISSMFTALFVTRVYFEFWARKKSNKHLSMANWIRKAKFDFLKRSKLSLSVALGVILAGSYFLFAKSSTILGLDFTGGHALTIEIDKVEGRQYGEEVQKALLAKGAQNGDFLVQELTPSNHLRILFGQSMEKEGKPFYGLALDHAIEPGQMQYMKNPKISWVVEALTSYGIGISEKNLSNLHADWTAVSGQMSDTMRNSAGLGLLLSFIAIFIYLAFRFEYKFAAAAVVCVIHDALITIALMGILHAFGVPVQLDLITIAAIMTVIGYSLNDTIIIFDRIREEMHHFSKRKLRDTINEALNFTLSRTMITSGSTLLVLLALLFFGGASIFGFALVMTIGVVLGTLSSWFIAAPLVIFFQKREHSKGLATS